MDTSLIPDDPTTGVWLVGTFGGYEQSLSAVFPGTQELEARRFADDQGYGDVAFAPFGAL